MKMICPGPSTLAPYLPRTDVTFGAAAQQGKHGGGAPWVVFVYAGFTIFVKVLEVLGHFSGDFEVVSCFQQHVKHECIDVSLMAC